MDLISRETVVNELEKNKYSRDFCSEHMIDFSINMGMARTTVASIPSAFDGMTNWEALKTVFPYAEIVGGDITLTAIRIDSNPKTGTPIVMYTEWLNAPYSTIPKVRDKWTI